MIPSYEEYLKQGSTGPRVGELQTALNEALSGTEGYTPLKVDQKFGPKTAKALEQFQKASGFTGGDVDSVYGPQTAGAFESYFSTTPSGTDTGDTQLSGDVKQETGQDTTTTKDDYSLADLSSLYGSIGLGLWNQGQAKQLSTMNNTANGNVPAQAGGDNTPETDTNVTSIDSTTTTDTGANVPAESNIASDNDRGYVGAFDEKMMALLDKYLNPEPYAYNVQEDPAFESYKNTYTRLGEKSFEDTLGNLVARTGGRPSSWAISAASQAKDAYNQQLMDIVPQLEERAYGRHQDQLTNFYNQLNMLQNLDALKYGRYADERTWDISEAGLTGMYQGEPTQSAREFEKNFGVSEANITGQYQGQPTQSAREFEKNFGVSEANITGQYQGQPTQAAKQAEDTSRVNWANVTGYVPIDTSNIPADSPLRAYSDQPGGYQAEINRRMEENPNDPMIQVLHALRNEKIMASPELQEKYGDTMAQPGGIPTYQTIRDQTADKYQRMQDQINNSFQNRQITVQEKNALTNELNSELDRQLAAKASEQEQIPEPTQQQKNYYRNAYDYLLNEDPEAKGDPNAALAKAKTPSQRLAYEKSMGPELYQQLLVDLQNAAEAQPGPIEITTGDKLAAIQQEWSNRGMDETEIYNELKNYPNDYILDIGSTEYNRLLGIYEKLAGSSGGGGLTPEQIEEINSLMK
jgi:hypothetical protein